MLIKNLRKVPQLLLNNKQIFKPFKGNVKLFLKAVFLEEAHLFFNLPTFIAFMIEIPWNQKIQSKWI